MSKIKHGLSRSKIHGRWRSMLSRCNNENSNVYKHYGARGIKVCAEWSGEDGFSRFYKWALLNGYAENLTIDRIDCNKGYSPDNCRFIGVKEQCNNRTNNIVLVINGISDTAKNWSLASPVTYCAILYRIGHGWSHEEAVFTPSRMRSEAHG